MSTPTKILIFGSLAVLGAYFAIKIPGLPVEADELSAIFTGLGFVGVIAAFWHERESAASDEAEHRETIRAREAEHRELMLTMKSQNKATCHAARIAAMTASLTYCMEVRSKFTVNGVDVTAGTGAQAQKRKKKLDNRIIVLSRQLDEASDISEVF